MNRSVQEGVLVWGAMPSGVRRVHHDSLEDLVYNDRSQGLFCVVG